MAIKNYVGNALAVQQVSTLTPGGTIAIGDTFTATMNGKSINFVTTDTTVATAINGLQQLWASLPAQIYPEFAEVIPTLNNSTSPTALVLTSIVADFPFVVTSSTTTSASATLTEATTTAATGPSDLSNTANWSTGALPASGDTVNVILPNATLYYNDNDSGVTLAALNIIGNINIGLPRINPNGYLEYRPLYWQISATLLYCNTTGNLIAINTGTIQTTITVDGTGPGINSPGFCWLGANSSNIIYRNGGTIGVAFNPAETVTCSAIYLGGTGNQDTSNSEIGAGVTVATINQSGGVVDVYCSATSVYRTGGTMNIMGNLSLAFGTLGNYTDSFNWTAPGTITALTANVAITSVGHAPKTITNGSILDPDAFPLDPNKTITYTNAVSIPPAGLNLVQVGFGRTVLVS